MFAGSFLARLKGFKGGFGARPFEGASKGELRGLREASGGLKGELRGGA